MLSLFEDDDLVDGEQKGIVKNIKVVVGLSRDLMKNIISFIGFSPGNKSRVVCNINIH